MYSDSREILVVVHEPERRQRVVRILADEGFAVTAASEGLSALRAVSARHYALIVASTALPGSLDGAATVRSARQRQPWLKALYVAEAADWPPLTNPETDDVITVEFQRWEFLGCTFELLQRQAMADAADLVRRIRTELRAS
jgi:two-component system response regulator MprA